MVRDSAKIEKPTEGGAVASCKGKGLRSQTEDQEIRPQHPSQDLESQADLFSKSVQEAL
jgi:hypothetical protein